jgi:hypothetical protein
MASAVLLSVIGRGKEWKLESGILPDFEMKNRKKEGKKKQRRPKYKLHLSV